MKAVSWPIRILWRGVRRVARWVVGAQRPSTLRGWGLLAGRATFAVFVVVVGRLVLDELTWTFREQLYAGGQALKWLIGVLVLIGIVIGVIALGGAALLDGGSNAIKPRKPAAQEPEKPVPPSLGARFGRSEATVTIPSAALPRVAHEARRAQQAAVQDTAANRAGKR